MLRLLANQKYAPLIGAFFVDIQERLYIVAITENYVLSQKILWKDVSWKNSTFWVAVACVVAYLCDTIVLYTTPFITLHVSPGKPI